MEYIYSIYFHFRVRNGTYYQKDLCCQRAYFYGLFISQGFFANQMQELKPIDKNFLLINMVRVYYCLFYLGKRFISNAKLFSQDYFSNVIQVPAFSQGILLLSLHVKCSQCFELLCQNLVQKV